MSQAMMLSWSTRLRKVSTILSGWSDPLDFRAGGFAMRSILLDALQVGLCGERNAPPAST